MERDRIDQLESAQPMVETLGDALPEAVDRATDRRRGAMAAALAPSVKASLREMARREPKVLGEMLAPTIGTAVRRAVTDAMTAMLQRLNQVLERGLSLRSLRWRMEARRSGRPFAEVVLLNTLVYRVEHVMLIHTETGLVLEQATAPGVLSQDPDQMSSMLQALSMFANDAFQPASPGAHLRGFEAGDLTVWVERDPLLTLAAVVRGEAPLVLRELLHETAARIRDRHRDDLARFQSDVSVFSGTRPLLEDCLRDEQRPSPPRGPLLLGLVGLVALVLVGSAVWTCARAPAGDELGAAYRAALDGAPGLVVTSIARAGDRYRLQGLHDPLAEPVEQILARAGLPAAQLELEPFYSLDPRIARRRLERALAPPSGVTLAFEQGTLQAAGHAPRAWVERSRILGAAMPGVGIYRDAELRADEDLADLRAATAALASTEIHFARGRAEVAPAERPAVLRAADLAEQVIRTATRARAAVCIEVIGHSDEPDRGARDQNLRGRRADQVARALRSTGLAARLLHPRAAGANEGGPPSRRVTLRAEARLGSSGPGCPP